MKRSEVDWSAAAKKAWKTIRANAASKKKRLREIALKAWRTRRANESKKKLMTLAKSGAPKPKYDSAFSKKLHKLSPQWFASKKRKQA